MSQYPPTLSFEERHFRWLQAIGAKIAPIDQSILGHQTALKDYGILLVNNMFLLNGGALFGIPAFTSAVSAKDQILAIALVPIYFFLFGLICGALSGFLAYLNFTFHNAERLYQRYIEYTAVNEVYFPIDNQRKLIEQAAIQSHSTNQSIEKTRSRINYSFGLLIATGCLSYGSFAAGAVFFLLKLPN